MILIGFIVQALLLAEITFNVSIITILHQRGIVMQTDNL